MQATSKKKKKIIIDFFPPVFSALIMLYSPCYLLIQHEHKIKRQTFFCISIMKQGPHGMETTGLDIT